MDFQERKTPITVDLRSIFYCGKSRCVGLSCKRRQKRIWAALVAIGPCVLITWQILVTFVSLNKDTMPNRSTADKSLLEKLPLKFNGGWSIEENWSKLPDLGSKVPKTPKMKTFAVEYFRKISKEFQQTRVQCSSLFAGNVKSVERAVGISKVLAALEKYKHIKSDRVARLKGIEAIPLPHKKVVRDVMKWPVWEFQRLTNQWYLKATKDCETFKRTRGYIMSALTWEEEEFPIAFSMVVYKDIEMVERLLRSVYRPQNSYCIHIDLKADPEFYAAMKALAGCFRENVRMSSERVGVQWGTYSILEPELICMQDLCDMDKDIRAANGDQGFGQGVKTRRKYKWKYFINLTGQEFPLKTNYELVKILKAFKGANNEEGTVQSAEKERWNSEPPHGIKAIKGAVHTVINRATVDFIVNSPVALDFLEWLRVTDVPDETLFASINYNPQLRIPGTYNGSHMETLTAFARFKKWNWQSDYKGCKSQHVVNDICILSTRDLKDLGKSPHLFANKFFLDQDRIVIGCLEEKHFNDTRDEYLGEKTVDTTLYSAQDFVLNQVRAAL